MRVQIWGSKIPISISHMGRKVLLVRLSVPDLRIEILPLPMLRGFLAREVVGEAEKEGVRPAELSRA